MKTKPLALVLVLVSAVVAIAQAPLRPGRWDTTMQMQMPGSPIQMPATKTSRCVTADDAKNPASTLPTGPEGRGGKQECKTSDYKQVGNTVTWQTTCAGSPPMTGTGEMTFTDDSYTGTMKMNMPQGAMTMKMTGTRVGDCTK